jgi:16S rRNA (guanine527-N7)-methyltransferase
VLERAQVLGIVGPAPVDQHIDLALGFGSAVVALDHGSVPDRSAESLTGGGGFVRALDLGTGAGLPGLVLAMAWPLSRWVLLDGMARRTGPLVLALETLALGDRVVVRTDRAENVGRDPLARRAFDLVTARSFGPPAVVAECAAPLLRVGGQLVVSDPPGGAGSRWPADGLNEVGLEWRGEVRGCSVLVQTRPCPDQFPRGVGRPAKRPLFS